MPCRYTRDEIIGHAISQARLANWEAHDMPDGVVLPHAFAIDWLQDIIDFWHHHVPFSATVKKTPLNATANQDHITLPSDFILDVRNGYWVQTVANDTLSYMKRFRLPLQKILNRKLSNQRSSNIQAPLWYCIQGDDGVVATQYQTMLIDPVPNINTNGYLWYYALPPKIEALHRPKLPSDYVGIEYVKLRGLENYHIIDIGTSFRFCNTLIASAKANGLLNEPEDDEVPFDEQVYVNTGGRRYSSYSWMGAV